MADTIFDMVTNQFRELVAAGQPIHHIIFNREGFDRAKAECDSSSIDRFVMGGPDTFMGLPYRIDPDLADPVHVSSELPPRPPLLNRMLGTPQKDYVLTVERLRDICDHVLDICEASPEVPIPQVLFPEGFQLTYATRERPVEL
jgi:hypothetical protein